LLFRLAACASWTKCRCPTGVCLPLFFFSSRRRHTRFSRDWSSDVCSSDLELQGQLLLAELVHQHLLVLHQDDLALADHPDAVGQDRKSTRLNSSHVKISYAVFCLKKKKKKEQVNIDTNTQ